jgi:hypothetical protein
VQLRAEGRSNERIYFQKIEGIQPYNWKPKLGRELLEENYSVKPLMMGCILSQPDHEEGFPPQSKHHSHHHHSKHHNSHNFVNLDTDQVIRHIEGENFHVFPIDPTYGEPQPFRTIGNVQWMFENDLVEPLGTGVETQQDIELNSKDYNKGKPDDPPEGCTPQYRWQELAFPNCNSLHELDLRGRVNTDVPVEDEPEPEGFLLASGGYRDVWFVENNHILSERVALKTLLYEHPYTERNMDRHRRDALATDRLTGSPYALNLYGYCANSGVYEFADGGSLEDAVDDDETYGDWNVSTKFKYAYQVAQAIADVHNIDKEGVPSMSHTDISLSQFVSINGGIDYKINDFNRARFLYHRIDNSDELCPFEVGSNKGKFRSPEEYGYAPETVKIDVYSMGNIFYVLLTGKYPFAGVEKKEAMQSVKHGKRQPIPPEYADSTDPMEQTLVQAIERCWIQTPEQRASAREIERLLGQVWKKHQRRHRQHKGGSHHNQ